jgi:acetyl-CoA acetyltransferase
MTVEYSHRDKCAIVGIGSTEFSANSRRSALTLASEAVTKALNDAGLTIDDIDGLVRCDTDKVAPYSLAAALGARNVAYWGDAGPGGNAPCMMMASAVGAILSGQAKVVVVYRALNGRSQMRLGSGTRRDGGGAETVDEFYVPYGVLSPGHLFAMVAQRYVQEYGLTPEQLGMVAVTQRLHANQAPHAQMHGRPMSLDDYLAARMLSTPLRLFDYCLETDGACAFIVTSADRASDLRRPPVLIRAVSGGVPPDIRPGMLFSTTSRDDMTDLPGRWTAARLWKRAGMGPDDMDTAQLYDCFSIAVPLQLEAYGFCGRGEGGAFVADGQIGRLGRVPVNTAGGHLSEGYIHGVNHILEAVRQLRGEADMQIANVDVSLVTSGPLPMASAAVLRKAA